MKITKRSIVEKLKEIYKAQDRTALFKFYHVLTGHHGESTSWNAPMRHLFESFCTSEKMRRVISALCETKWLKEVRNNNYERVHLEFMGERPRPSLTELTRRERAEALRMLRRLYEEPVTNYTKVPMFGFNHLYFCSPSYGLKDYNKVRTCLLCGPLSTDRNGNRCDPQAAWCSMVVNLGKRIYESKMNR